MAFKPAGLLTGIGSMPYTNSGEALDLIFQNMPQAPHWPQMPRRGNREGLVFQFLTPLVKTGLIQMDGDKAYFNTQSDRWGEGMTEFYALYLAAVEGDTEALKAFSIPEESAAGFYSFINRIQQNGAGEAMYLKGHIAGPLTVGFNLKDEKGKFAYYNDQLRDLLVKTLALQSRWQVMEIAKLGRPVIFFVDEPAISVYGKSDYITITKEMIQKDLNEIADQVHDAGALVGVHSCDAIDWSILYQCNIDIVNLDVYNFNESLLPFASELKDFLSRGGVLAQGIIPTSDEAFSESSQTLFARLQATWQSLQDRGIPTRQLMEQTMITPACGTGLLGPELAVHIYRLAREVSDLVREMVQA